MLQAKGYSVTPQPEVGQQGAAWIRWVDHYAADHAARVAQIVVRDFPPLVREQITQEDGETMTPSTMQRIVTVMARLGAAHGLRQVPFTLEDVVALTQALVLDNALTPLHGDALIGEFHVDDPATGRAGALGRAGGVPPAWRTAAVRSGRGGEGVATNGSAPDAGWGERAARVTDRAPHGVSGDNKAPMHGVWGRPPGPEMGADRRTGNAELA